MIVRVCMYIYKQTKLSHSFEIGHIALIIICQSTKRNKEKRNNINVMHYGTIFVYITKFGGHKTKHTHKK